MTRHVILSNQQLISIIERLGYHTYLKEEMQFRVDTDHSCTPFLVSTLQVKLPDHPFHPPAEAFPMDNKTFLN
jgi:hypothetical protein